MLDFFRCITAKLVSQPATNKPSAGQYQSNQIQLYENNMIYYRRHNPNKELYK